MADKWCRLRRLQEWMNLDPDKDEIEEFDERGEEEKGAGR